MIKYKYMELFDIEYDEIKRWVDSGCCYEPRSGWHERYYFLVECKSLYGHTKELCYKVVEFDLGLKSFFVNGDECFGDIIEELRNLELEPICWYDINGANIEGMEYRDE